jgi:hypothetical protein
MSCLKHLETDRVENTAPVAVKLLRSCLLVQPLLKNGCRCRLYSFCLEQIRHITPSLRLAAISYFSA